MDGVAQHLCLTLNEAYAGRSTGTHRAKEAKECRLQVTGVRRPVPAQMTPLLEISKA
jgi:hypothetical protein